MLKRLFGVFITLLYFLTSISQETPYPKPASPIGNRNTVTKILGLLTAERGFAPGYYPNGTATFPFGNDYLRSMFMIGANNGQGQRLYVWDSIQNGFRKLLTEDDLSGINNHLTAGQVAYGAWNNIIHSSDSITKIADTFKVNAIIKLPQYSSSAGKMLTVDNSGNLISQNLALIDGIVSGGSVLWLGNLDYYVSPAVFNLANHQYIWNGGIVTLPPGSGAPGESRFDAIILTLSSGVPIATSKQGTNATSPQTPFVDVSTEVWRAFVQINEDQTVPSTVNVKEVWDENIGAPEYTDATQGTVTVNPNYATLVATGAKSMRVTAMTVGSSLTFTSPGAAIQEIGQYQTFSFQVHNNIALPAGTVLTARFYLGNTALGVPVDITRFGYDPLRTAAGFQTIVLPLYAFGAQNFTDIYITCNGVAIASGDVVFDDFQLQGGNGSIGVSTITAAGNFGNVQINRFGSFTTPSLDSLSFDPNGLKIGQPNPTSTALLRVGQTKKYASSDKPIFLFGTLPTGNVNNNWGEASVSDSITTTSGAKIIGFSIGRNTYVNANNLSFSFNYGVGIGRSWYIKDSVRYNNQNNDGNAAVIGGLSYYKYPGQTTRSAFLTGGVAYDHSQAMLMEIGFWGGSGTNNFVQHGWTATYYAYPISDNPNHTDSMENFTGYGTGGAGNSQPKIMNYRGFLATPGGTGANIYNKYYSLYGTKGSSKPVFFFTEGSARIGGVSASDALGNNGDDTARFGAMLDVDGPIVMRDGNQAAGRMIFTDANGKFISVDTTGLFPGVGGSGLNIYNSDGTLLANRTINGNNFTLHAINLGDLSLTGPSSGAFNFALGLNSTLSQFTGNYGTGAVTNRLSIESDNAMISSQRNVDGANHPAYYVKASLDSIVLGHLNLVGIQNYKMNLFIKGGLGAGGGSDSVLVRNASTGEVRAVAQSDLPGAGGSPDGNGIYSGGGVLQSGTTTINGAGDNSSVVVFDNVNQFEVNANDHFDVNVTTPNYVSTFDFGSGAVTKKIEVVSFGTTTSGLYFGSGGGVSLTADGNYFSANGSNLEIHGGLVGGGTFTTRSLVSIDNSGFWHEIPFDTIRNITTAGLVPITRTVNGKPLSSNITLLLTADFDNQGTTTTVLHGNAAGDLTFAKVSMVNDVTGVLGAANGGTGNQFFTVAGLSTSAKTFTFPNANATVLTTNAAVTVPQGGTGAVTLTGYLKGNGAAAFTAVATIPGTDITGNIAGTAVNVSGVVAIANGGTGQNNANGAITALLPTQTGHSGQALITNGTVAAWTVIPSGGGGVVDPGANGIMVRTALNTTVARTLTAASTRIAIGNGDGTTGNPTIDVSEGNLSLPNIGGTLTAVKGGTGQTVYAIGDILFASTTTALSKLADIAAGNVLLSGGVGAAPTYGKVNLTTMVTAVLPIANGGTGQATAAAALNALLPTQTGNAGKALQTDGTNATWTLRPNYTVQTLTDGATVTMNVLNGINAKWTNAGTGRTLVLSNRQAGWTYTIEITQGSGGSKTVGTWPSGITWVGGTAPVLSTVAGTVDIVSFFDDGTNLRGNWGLKYQ